MFLFILGVIVGVILGFVTCALLAARSYEKGRKAGYVEGEFAGRIEGYKEALEKVKRFRRIVLRSNKRKPFDVGG